MLVELQLKQDNNLNKKRWFQDDYFDLFTWQTPQGHITSFQLCYDRLGDERVVLWDKNKGFAHHRVDDGESSPHKNMTPVFIRDGSFSYDEVVPKFASSSQRINSELRDFIIQKLNEYLQQLRRG
jgi:hypothetical protein